MNTTHKELVEAAYRWVIKNASCGVAFKELYTSANNGEYPDVIGFGSGGHSVLIECKCSRSDFHADKKKMFRANPQLGMGSERIYCCPTGLIKKEELPENWGLLYVNEKGKAIAIHRARVPLVEDGTYTVTYRHEKNIKAEHELMYSVLRRLNLRNVIDLIYEKSYQENA